MTRSVVFAVRHLYYYAIEVNRLIGEKWFELKLYSNNPNPK